MDYLGSNFATYGLLGYTHTLVTLSTHTPLPLSQLPRSALDIHAMTKQVLQVFIVSFSD